MKEEKSAGVIVILKGEEDRLLILQQTQGHWSFPKGHIEEGETVREAAIRELEEETGITEVEISNLPHIIEEYDFLRNGVKTHKTNEYVIGFVKNDKVVIQEKEVLTYKWATFDEITEICAQNKSISNFDLEAQKLLLQKIKNHLENQ